MSAVTTVPPMVPMAEEVHQRTSQEKQEGQQLREMRVVAIEHPANSRGEADPEHPLIDAGPIGTRRLTTKMFVRAVHDVTPHDIEKGPNRLTADFARGG